MNKFTFFWKTGHREVLEGNNVRDAFLGAGYGGGALGAVDFWDHGDSQAYLWNKATRSWEAAEKPAYSFIQG